MMRDTNLNEIREKIYQLRTAIMYSMSNDVCRLPNCIVTAVQVDEHGQLWFTCPRPLQKVSELEHSFPARLHFYHKGVFFHVEVSGSARIVSEDSIDDSETGKGGQMLICMSMNTVEYTEPYVRKERSRMEHLIDRSYRWIVKNIGLPLSHSGPALSKNSMS